MKQRLIAIASLLFVLTCGAFAAETGAFAGTWKQNMEKSTNKPSWLKSYEAKIDINGDKLTITTTMVSDRGERSYDRTYTLGKEEQSVGGDGDQFTTTVKIDGRSLIFDIQEKEGNVLLTSHEVWTVSEDGKTMTKTIKHSGGPRGPSEQEYFYDKEAPSAAPVAQ